ncbi:MAG TPA: hypothetical protein VFT82_02800 [Candidatus Paceibacterota bacterium]|nr:hypothetical protein [Candidatus Paceibacterota bacterium]
MKTYGTKLVVSVVAFIAVVGGIFAYIANQGNEESSEPISDETASSASAQPTVDVTSPATPVTAPSGSSNAPTSSVASKYKDGTYQATGTYESPGGSESIGVSLTLKSGVVTAATVTRGANDSWSERYQSMFISGYKAYVVGKNIDTINLDRVSGSSLTPKGFNAALTQIKSEAKA